MRIKTWSKVLSIALATIAFSGQAKFQPLELKDGNPGELAFKLYLPEQAPKRLLVLLHGCADTGENFAVQSGFYSQAEKHNITLLVPEQSASNNVQRCFNWFSPLDNKKGVGETQSIKNAIVHIQTNLQIKQTYIAGLSAGGAMASNLLSHYPELFAAGAVIAGVPYPCADSLVKAISCMKSGPALTPQQLASKFESTSQTWPDLIVITGGDDQIVAPKNSTFLAQQWAHLHKLRGSKTVDKTVGETLLSISTWPDLDAAKVQLIEVAKLAHGIPVAPSQQGGGQVAPFYLESDFSAAVHLAKTWF